MNYEAMTGLEIAIEGDRLHTDAMFAAAEEQEEILRAQLEVLEAATVAVGSRLHDDWREENFGNGDGTYRPRVKQLVQSAVDGSTKWVNEGQYDPFDGEYVVLSQDIANTPFEELHPDWQADNYAAARTVVDLLVEYNGEVDLDNIEVHAHVGNTIHNAWLQRASWIEPGLEVPFSNLPPEQQAKDIAQIETAKAVFGIE